MSMLMMLARIYVRNLTRFEAQTESFFSVICYYLVLNDDLCNIRCAFIVVIHCANCLMYLAPYSDQTVLQFVWCAVN